MEADSVQQIEWLLAAAGAGAIVLWLAWMQREGVVRGTLATLCRIGWVAPLFLAFYPITTSEPLPRSLAVQPLNVLVDDSASMQNDSDVQSELTELLDMLRNDCNRFGCAPKVTLLSQLEDEALAQGYTPLRDALGGWLMRSSKDPWVILTDGADERPTLRWDSSWRGIGRDENGQSIGFVGSFGQPDQANVWIDGHKVPPFSFENQPLSLTVGLNRTAEGAEERVQLQVYTGDQPLATVNAEFAADETKIAVPLTLPALPRGQHLLTIQALPTAAERTLWDNTNHVAVEVMPNTVGVLHLLGSPSWDGRFLRRYLKAEPKYDLISFFILRDPWDSQQVSEREMSLIPFPVERLFNEELPNFRVVIIQNFQLFQFLLPEYQSNLVDFVKSGGGLLFMGGPRALQDSDVSSSPLREILPFDVDPRLAATRSTPGILSPFGSPRRQDSGRGPTYDPDVPYRIELANPGARKRALADVYTEWEQMRDRLQAFDNAKGLHRMERIKLKDDVTTTLLNAVRTDGSKVPLAVASYPGKGRAVWLFTDSLWRLALNSEGGSTRQSYNRFMQATMTWLMRQDLRKPLLVNGLKFTGGRQQEAGFQFDIQGPAVRYFSLDQGWSLEVCGVQLGRDQYLAIKEATDHWRISGSLPVNLAGGQRCLVTVRAEHPAFGSAVSTTSGVYPERYQDQELAAAPHKLERLANLTGAVYAPNGDVTTQLQRWLEERSPSEGIALPNRFRTFRDFYWPLDRPWVWAMLMLLPIEVVVRRWPQLTSGARRRKLRGPS